MFLHGCAGLPRRQQAWADELSREGYAVLVLDSFGARGITRVCGDGGAFPGAARALDPFAAVRGLREVAWVDRSRIAAVGWSHGGWTTHWALVRQGEHPAERL
ncbi:MAG: prolyl oligopeptidase family serine peptidase, partial [Candidatus Rokubacteria bacterium]|nr:prolyl oligopeptidase family serine peptidase [Candidatus Rokubacteria bacterium]